jgi:hypothetical protein
MVSCPSDLRLDHTSHNSNKSPRKKGVGLIMAAFFVIFFAAALLVILSSGGFGSSATNSAAGEDTIKAVGAFFLMTLIALFSQYWIVVALNASPEQSDIPFPGFVLTGVPFAVMLYVSFFLSTLMVDISPNLGGGGTRIIRFILKTSSNKESGATEVASSIGLQRFNARGTSSGPHRYRPICPCFRNG